MKLEQQVCSLELSKRLRELGVKQESVFYHLDCSWGWEIKREEDIEREGIGFSFAYSAFTVAELGEMLPWRLNGKSLTATKGVFYELFYDEGTVDTLGSYEAMQAATTEADARARMLIYLIENNLITL